MYFVAFFCNFVVLSTANGTKHDEKKSSSIQTNNQINRIDNDTSTVVGWIKADVNQLRLGSVLFSLSLHFHSLVFYAAFCQTIMWFGQRKHKKNIHQKWHCARLKWETNMSIANRAHRINVDSILSLRPHQFNVWGTTILDIFTSTSIQCHNHWQTKIKKKIYICTVFVFETRIAFTVVKPSCLWFTISILVQCCRYIKCLIAKHLHISLCDQSVLIDCINMTYSTVLHLQRRDSLNEWWLLITNLPMLKQTVNMYCMIF